MTSPSVKSLSVFAASRHHALAAIALAAGLCAAMLPAVAADAQSATVGAAVSDATITTKVKAGFIGKDAFKGSNISVSTANGVVKLEGSAASTEAKAAAESAARAVEGVKRVDNTLSVGPASTMQTKTGAAAAETERVVSDSWITTKVKSEILAHSVSKSFKVSVKTKRGVVALKGKLATQDSIDLVKALAEKVKGVKSVDTSGLSVRAA